MHQDGFICKGALRKNTHAGKNIPGALSDVIFRRVLLNLLEASGDGLACNIKK